ncbi:MAG: hypothetical protein HAW60_01905 [Bdellovibrionales bacterium]|nr:hypothetical protein [Bdellovibrionales bacterium]
MIYNFFTYFIFLFLFFSPHYLSSNKIQPPVFIIWNIGQGSWSSLVTNNTCFHFDMGGKRLHKKNKIIQSCKKKQNILLLTHADTDHVNLTYQFKKKWIKFCLYKNPREQPKKYNKRYLKNLQLCSKKTLMLLKKQDIVEIKFSIPKKNTFYKKKYYTFKSGIKSGFKSGTKSRFKSGFKSGFKHEHKSNPKSRSNFLSRIFLVKKLILIGGDSTKKAELLWKNNIPNPEKIKYFLLNHHGSKNSNHIKLLKKLKNLKVAIASAKKSRYKHPHKKVVLRLKKQKVALLQTEVWGSIYIYLKK